jgi:hypothetical protein
MRIVCLAVIALFAPRAVASQTTAEGVQALIRGDYAAAVRILEPLANDFRQPDPVAQFFMATLYQTGRGVESDPIRACGLFSRAATPESPLLVQALTLARAIHRDVPIVRDLCSAGSAHEWREPPATSFALGPAHSVRIDATSITVSHAGLQKAHKTVISGPGFVFLPFRHTQLDVSRPVEGRRHFIESFFWMPMNIADPPGWKLGWVLSEVVGTAWVPITADPELTTIAGPEPPTAFEGPAVGVRVNANFEAEWFVLGARPRGGVIPARGSR